jgi:hypothetical protein
MQGHWVHDVTYYWCRFPAEYALADHRAALDVGADPASVARWITETEAEKAGHELAKPKPASSTSS